MIKLKDLILEGRLKSVTVITADVMKRIVDVAQKQYNQWAQDEEGYNEELGSGGICHLIAEEIAGILSEHGINASTVSSNFEQHVYVVAQFKEGIYEIDIPYHHYEQGGGFTWKKLPDIIFDTSHIVLHRLDSNPKSFEKYIDLNEERDKLNETTDLKSQVKELELKLEKEFPQLEELNLYMRSAGDLYIDSIKVKPEEKHKGIGSQVMKRILKFSDDHDLYTTLHMVSERGYKDKLKRFYQQFGFWPNRGRKTMYQFSSPFHLIMVRRPKNKDILKEEFNNSIINKVQQLFVDYYDYKNWEEFVDKQEIGDCQTIVNMIISKFKQFQKVVGEIEVDKLYTDEYGEQQNKMLHHWVKLDGIPYEFSKGTLKNYIEFQNLYDVDVEDSLRYHIGNDLLLREQKTHLLQRMG